MYMRGSDIPPTRCYAILPPRKPQKREKQLGNMSLKGIVSTNLLKHRKNRKDVPSGERHRLVFRCKEALDQKSIKFVRVIDKNDLG